MSFTQEQIDKLRAQIAEGVRKVEFSDGRSVQYVTVDEALALIARMERAISEAARPQMANPVVGRGFR